MTPPPRITGVPDTPGARHECTKYKMHAKNGDVNFGSLSASHFLLLIAIPSSCADNGNGNVTVTIMIRSNTMSARLRSTIKLVKPRSISTSTSSSSSSSSPTSSSPHSCWSFHLSTAFHGKPKDDHNKSNNSRTLLQGFSPNSPIALWRDAATLKAKAPWGAGHDWYMIEPFPAPDAAASQSTTSTSSTISTPFQGVAIAVADGVGGWEDSGVDPSHFSQALMYYCAQAVKNSSEHDPVEIMKRGYQGVTQEPGVVAGE